MTMTAGSLTTDRCTSTLQDTLVELIDLALQGKQAHWTVTGPQFKPLHEHLDALVDDARTWYDDVAERLAALDVAPDGRTATVAAHSPLAGLPAGWQAGSEVIAAFTERLTDLGIRLRDRVTMLADDDPVSQDLLIGIAHGVDKHAWMFRVQRR
jgi:starvation-inducible DNA-binding protein